RPDLGPDAEGGPARARVPFRHRGGRHHGRPAPDVDVPGGRRLVGDPPGQPGSRPLRPAFVPLLTEGHTMAKLLVVRAHPLTSEFSRSMQLADEFVRVYSQTHPDDDVLDLNLYNRAVPEIDLDLLSAWKKIGSGTPFAHLDQAEQLKATLFDGYTSQFLNVDKIVVANPLWNLNVPTRLKAWIDMIAVAGQ